MKKLTYFACAILLIGFLACKNKSAQKTDQQPQSLQEKLQPAGLEGEAIDQNAPSQQNKTTDVRKKTAPQEKAKQENSKKPLNPHEGKGKKGEGGGGEPIAQLGEENQPAKPVDSQVKAIKTSQKILDEENKTQEQQSVETAERQPKTEKSEEITTAKAPSHAAWDALLEKYVSASGKVNYQGFKKEEGKLDSYLATLKNNPPQTDWSRNEKLAYWINVYNAFTVKLIVKNHPVESITDLHGGKPWDVKWIDIGTKTYTLNEVEHDIIRPRFNEPRIHFAVNCAAQSCPPLLNAAYTADKLNTQLEQQTKKFINNSKFNSISASSVEVSKIFDWYKEDFDNLIAFLDKYAQTDINSNASVTYKNYDWALND